MRAIPDFMPWDRHSDVLAHRQQRSHDPGKQKLVINT
jgi:hypothetical protein